MRRLLLSLVAMVLLVFGQQVTHAQDSQSYILSQSYYLDKTNALTYAEVQSMAFTPYQGLFTGGFSQGAYWIKLSVRAHAQNVVLKIRPSYTNEIQFYDPSASGKPRVTGSIYPMIKDDIEANSFNFVLSPSASNRDVYLRIKSVSSYLFYVEAMSMSAFERSERTDNFIYMGYVMLTLILAIWLLITWLMNRERVIGVFTVQQILAFTHTFIKVGFARTYLDLYVSAELINAISNMVVVFYPLVALTANFLLFQEYGIKKSFRYGYFALMVWSLGINATFMSGAEVLALTWNVKFVLVMMAGFALCSLWGTNPSKALESSNAVQLKVLRYFYCINFIVWLIALLPLLGIISTGTVALHSLFVYNMMSSIVFFILLSNRARWLLKHEVARTSTLQAEATQERQRREEQGMLMAMLSHEIKTPLSVLKLVMDEKVAGSDLEGHANRAVSNINFIVNRCLQLGKLDAKAIQLNPTSFSAKDFVLALLQDIQGASRVQTDIPDSLVLSADREILRLVLNNLIENALKYSDPVQAVQLNMLTHSEEVGRRVVIEVRNKVGHLGVPDPDQVFKKYYRNTQATKVTGSGLGLFLVHELVGVMGGEVSYTNENDEVIFSIWIPT